MPNASLGNSQWGGINAPIPPVRQPPKGQPPLQQYSLDQVLYYHEMRLRQVEQKIMRNVANEKSATEENVVHEDVGAVVAAVEARMKDQEKKMIALQSELAGLKQENTEQVELVVEES